TTLRCLATCCCNPEEPRSWFPCSSTRQSCPYASMSTKDCTNTDLLGPHFRPTNRRSTDGSGRMPQQGQNWLLRARLLRDILQAKGYDFTYHETGGAHEGLHWRATLAEGLIALLGQSAN